MARGVIETQNMITIGNPELADKTAEQKLSRRQLKNEITNRMLRFSEDGQNTHEKVLFAFMLDFEAEELYG